MTKRELNFGNPAALMAALSGDLSNAITAATPGGIEAQEAQGQRDLCRSTTKLPVDFGYDKTGKAALEAAGVKFGEVIANDPIWRSVELPAGWKLRPTDHSMWSDLVDHLERPRARVFYKAAFYDRSCHIHVCRRFNIECDYPNDMDAGGPYFGIVKDGDREIWRSEATHNKPDARGSEQARDLAQNWLKENRPDWENMSAYWDE